MMPTCPACSGERVPDDDPQVLNSYVHASTCALLLAERETFDVDRRRFLRRGRAVRHRTTTSAERSLCTASGASIDARTPMFVRIEWSGPDLRLRMFTRAGLVAVDEVQL